MNRKKYLAVLLGLSTLLPVHAAYVNGEMLFEETFASPESLSKWKISGKVTRLEKGGPDNGPCVKLEVPKHGNASISLSLDPKKITGMIAFEAMVKGENLRQGIKPFFGPNTRFSSGTPSSAIFSRSARPPGFCCFSSTTMSRLLGVLPLISHHVSSEPLPSMVPSPVMAMSVSL